MVGRRGSPHFTVESIAPGTWMARALDGGYGLCNSGIVDLGGRTVVFDTMLTPAAGRDLVRTAAALTGRRPDFAINSHWHGDHIRGNQAFRPAPVVSTTKTRDLIRTLGPEQWRSDLREMPGLLKDLGGPESPLSPADRAMCRGWYEGTLAVARPFRPSPPDLTFERELVLAGSRRSLVVRSYGGGHSPSDTFAYLPDDKTAFLGDLLAVGLHPSAGDGVPSRWRRILRRIRTLGVRDVVPGHGPRGKPRDLRAVERYLAYLDRRAAAAIRRREPRGSLRSLPVPSEFGRWRQPMFFAENLLRAYDLRAGA